MKWRPGIALILLVITAGCDSYTPIRSNRPRPNSGRPLHTLDRNTDDDPRQRLQSHLIAYLPLDGNASDISGNGHSGVVMGARPTRDRYGYRDRAYRFDGVDDHIILRNSSTLKISPPISISIWVRPDQTASTVAAVTTDYSTQFNSGVFIAFDSNGGNPSISFGDGSSLGHDSRRTRHALHEIVPDRWTHVVGTISADYTMTMYVNGLEDNGPLDGSAQNLAFTDGPAAIGIRTTTVGNPPLFYSGALDDLAIFDSALTPADVRYLYFGGEPVR